MAHKKGTKKKATKKTAEPTKKRAKRPVSERHYLEGFRDAHDDIKHKRPLRKVGKSGHTGYARGYIAGLKEARRARRARK